MMNTEEPLELLTVAGTKMTKIDQGFDNQTPSIY